MILERFIFIKGNDKDLFFAIEHGKINKELDDLYGGWNILDLKKEFKRQGLKIASEGQPNQNIDFLYRYVDNKNFKLCGTYPPLFVVPIRASDVMLQGSAKYRTKERIPTITYYHSGTKTILARSSQCKVFFKISPYKTCIE